MSKLALSTQTNFSYFEENLPTFEELCISLSWLAHLWVDLLNQAQVGFILLQTPSILTRLVQKSAESTPELIFAHSDACLLTYEQACSVLLDSRSIWYVSSSSSCHELSNEMLDYILFFRVSNSSAKNFFSGGCSKSVCAHVRSPPLHKHRICDRQN